MDPQTRAVADELEIRNLLAKLAQHADDGNLEEYLQLFTEDTVWDAGEFGKNEGLEAIERSAKKRRANGTTGPGTNTRHLVSTSLIEVDGDEARGRSVYHFYTHIHETPRILALGMYEDRYRRTPQGWKLAHRKIC